MVMMCNCGSMEWFGGLVCCGWWKNMLLEAGRICLGLWKNMIWGLSTAVWWNGRICCEWRKEYGLVCCWMVEWKNMPLNGRTCSGWKKMLLVVGEEAHFGYKIVFNAKWWMLDQNMDHNFYGASR
uniref:Candidate secreted effector n=1 Tax=Meloidogyne incognita TaxID=6306 RepID=A0A914L5D9_MELIC